MALIFKVEEKIHKMIVEYLDQVDHCMETFEKEIAAHLTEGQCPNPFPEGGTHSYESKADDLRRNIEMLLYGRELLPESRGDLLVMLETYDRIPNAAETTLAIIEAERVVIPEQFKKDFTKLVRVNLDAFRGLRRTADALFDNPRQTGYLQKEVDIKESESDRLERRLISDVFDSDLDKADKLQLRNVIVSIGNISDRAENASDRIGIIAIKRRI